MCQDGIEKIMIQDLVLQNFVIEWGLALVRGSDSFVILKPKGLKGGEIKYAI